MSSAMSNLLLDKEILLESGTNELELLVFNVADYTFGINVAKVREVLPATSITLLPRAHRSIRGVFKLRNRVIPCVSLVDHLEIQPRHQCTEATMILTDFNEQQTAFLVDRVEHIHRLSWEQILSVPGLVVMAQSPMTGVAKVAERMVVMLDFEMIIDQVTDKSLRHEAVPNPLQLPRESLRLLLADDSPTVREAVGNTLHNSGYTKTKFFENGAEVWNWLNQEYQATGRLEDVADLLISDIEMPQVDGLHLTRRIKEHAVFKRLPVLLFSSIVTPDNLNKGRSVGADAQIAKPQLNRVVELADELILASRRIHDLPVSRGEVEIPLQATALPTAAAPPKSTPPAPAPRVERSTPAAPAAAAKTTQPAPSQAGLLSATVSLRVIAPSNTDPRLWQTFHQELQGHVERLRDNWNKSGSGNMRPEVLNDTFRSLHTIKSASMVVPLEPVTRATHLMESLLEVARQGHCAWPGASLHRYLEWLESLVQANEPADDVLTAVDSLVTVLTDQLDSLAAQCG